MLRNPLANALGQLMVSDPCILCASGEIVDILMRKFKMDMTSWGNRDQVSVGDMVRSKMFRENAGRLC
jgi:hypothetical protein